MANLLPSPLRKAAQHGENMPVLENHNLVAKWLALCAWEDDVSTEVVVERVEISVREQHRILCAMDVRVLRQQTEYDDIGQEHDIPVPLWYTKRRGSACSSQSAGCIDSRGSVASADIGDGGFKAWAKSEEPEEESDVWRFGRNATEQQPRAGGSAHSQKEKRQPSTGTCNPQ